MFDSMMKKLSGARVVPVVKVSDVDVSLALASSLASHGMKAIEITFRTTEGESGFKKISDCIAAIKNKFPSLTVGAGTVINPDLAQRAFDAGAEFVVSPGFNPATVKWCIEHEIPVIPGVCTPSEIELALMHGLDVLKFFPSEAMGGVKMLKSLAGPFPTVRFMPTGGICLENVKDYLSLGNVIAAGGSWMCSEKLIAEKAWDVVSSKCDELFAIL